MKGCGRAMKIFLTGGTGYLGGALLRALLEEGHEVTVFSRRVRDEGAQARLRWVRGDLARELPPDSCLLQSRAVIHSAALVKSWARDRGEFDRVNVQAYDGLLERCARLGVTKILHTSSFLSLGPSPEGQLLREEDRSARGGFLTDYERTKYLADEITDRWVAQGVPVSTLYPTILFGPGSCSDGNLVGKMIFWIAHRRFPGLVGDGARVWNLAYLDDVVRGHLLALARALPGKRYILGGENILLQDLLAAIHKELGLPPRWRKIPVGVAENLGGLAEWGARFTGRAPDLTRGVAGVYRHHWAYDSARAEKDLGYRRTEFSRALSETVRWAAALPAWKEGDA
jgi:NAD+-dependent farnesol dehydrogenase